MKALLIIDMQKVSFAPDTPRYLASEVVSNINILSKRFRDNRMPVIHIQHDGSKDGFCMPGTKDHEFIDEVDVLPGDTIISKTVNNAFYKSTLKDCLIKSGIDDLVITGCATDFCIDTTVKSALTHDYNVVVISDGHTTADRPGISAKLVIEHYNWIWSEMIATKGSISVVNLEECINQFGY